MARLIDADALIEDIKSFWDWDSIDGITATTVLKQTMTDISHAPTIDAVPVETVCEMFGDEAPCNYGLFGVSVDDFMMSKCGKWCEDNCDKVPYTECWQKFFEAIEKWRKQND